MNIIVDHPKRILKLIDWGLSEFYIPDKEYNVRVASRPFKGPELLVDYQKYDYSLDIWSLGCIFGSMVDSHQTDFQKRTFVSRKRKCRSARQNHKCFGHSRTLRIPRQIQDKTRPFWILFSDSVGNIDSRKTKKEWSTFITSENAHLCSPEALDLLSKMLVYDHVDPISL